MRSKRLPSIANIGRTPFTHDTLVREGWCLKPGMTRQRSKVLQPEGTKLLSEPIGLRGGFAPSAEIPMDFFTAQQIQGAGWDMPLGGSQFYCLFLAVLKPSNNFQNHRHGPALPQ